MALLADMARATDEKLRNLAQRLAARLTLDLARSGTPKTRGVGRIVQASAATSQGDLDVDASLDELISARSTRRAPTLDELVVNDWSKPETALCLIVDKSGSMGSDRLAAAALAAASAAWRAPADHSVVVFDKEVLVIKPQNLNTPASVVVDTVLGLRGHGTTDLAAALEAAAQQLQRSDAKRKVAILMSDCVATAGEDPVLAARKLDELHIVAPADEATEAEEFAMLTGSSIGLLDGPAQIPAVFAAMFDR